MIESKAISIGNVAYVLGLDSKKLNSWYKHVLSGYDEARSTGEVGKYDLVVKEEGKDRRIRVPVFKPENMGRFMAIDEKNIAGDCYTIVSNRETSKIVLMAATHKASLVSKLLYGMDRDRRLSVKSLTRDLAASYDWVARECFMNAYQVADKFHVIRAVLEQVQNCRIRYRQELLSLKRKKNKTKDEISRLEASYPNEDRPLELLHRSRGLLFAFEGKWTDSQRERAQVLFSAYPEIKEAYKYALEVRKWYQPIKRYTDSKYEQKRAKLDALIEKGRLSKVEEVKNIARLLDDNKAVILAYFYRRETNAKAEALNQNLQRFISINYGARETDFFLYRVALQFS